MARHESDFCAGGDEPLPLEKPMCLLQPGDLHAQSREGAIASFLSAGESADEAVKKLGGAFAEAALGLTERKLDWLGN